MAELELDAEDDDNGFWMHAKSVFNRRFYAINTDLHSLALFLQPKRRKLAVTDASKGGPYESVALAITPVVPHAADVKRLLSDMGGT
ncbi:hypothetical protein BDR04DRAFT_1100610 [Suillus decipiens]|nr:hypothetical protein BDR04DRAFT_1100610 [Suillus decipiens]